MNKKPLFFILTLGLLLLFVGSADKAKAADPTQDGLKPCMTKICKDLFKQYKKYARKRHSSAMYVLGEFYYHGYGTKVDKERALRFYKKASIYDFRQAQFKAGSMYFYDPEFMDKEKGVTYLKEAARNKHAHAAFALGLIFSGNQMGQSDHNEADKWLSIAIEEKHQKAAEYAQKLQTTTEFSAENYPEISQYLAEITKETALREMASQENSRQEVTLLAKKKTEIQSAEMPEDDGSNVLTVQGPSLQQLLIDDILRLRNTFPDGAKQGTGSNIRGKKCETCAVMDPKMLKRMISGMVLFEASMIPTDLE